MARIARGDLAAANSLKDLEQQEMHSFNATKGFFVLCLTCTILCVGSMSV